MELPTTITLRQKLQQLQQVFELYSTYTDSLALACRKHCCRCCTRNVALTSLEATAILERLGPVDTRQMLAQLQAVAALERFQPRITTNEMARRCIQGQHLPEESCDPDWGPCPLLENRACSIYPLRPFACRCLLSRTNCAHSDCADMDEFTLAVNVIFLQVIEHLDRDGCTGNFSDVLVYLSKTENMDAYRQGRLDCAGGGLLCNQPLKTLMLPPSYRRRAAPLLQRLQRIGIG